MTNKPDLKQLLNKEIAKQLKGKEVTKKGLIYEISKVLLVTIHEGISFPPCNADFSANVKLAKNMQNKDMLEEVSTISGTFTFEKVTLDSNDQKVYINNLNIF